MHPEKAKESHRLRIVFLSDTFLPQINGVATSIANFAQELGRRGHEVMIVCPALPARKRVQEWSSEGVQVVRLPSFPALLYPGITLSPLVGLPKCLAALRGFHPDVIHLQTTLAISIDAVAAKQFFDCPLVGTNHIFLTSTEWECLAFLTKKKVILRHLAKIAFGYSLAFYNACDLCLAPSRRLIEALKEEKITTTMMYLPNGVPRPQHPEGAAQARLAIRQRYGLPEKVVLHVGRLSPEKRIDHLLRAVAFLPDDAALLIVGDGPDRKRLEQLAKALNIDRRVFFIGFIPNAELLTSGIYAAADAFATASTMESQGMVLVEAMAHGLPIVAVNVGAIPEVVGAAGSIVDEHDVSAFAEALGTILATPRLAATMREAALQQYEQFSIEHLTDELLGMYALAATIHHGKPRRHQRLRRLPGQFARLPRAIALRMSKELTAAVLRTARGVTIARLAVRQRNARNRRR